MTDSELHSCLKYVPAPLRSDAARLLGISPLFTSLIRSMDEAACRALFQSERQALLPDGGPEWVPPHDSDDLDKCMRHLRLCKQRGLAHVIWWELGLGADVARSWLALADFACGLLKLALGMAGGLLEPRFGRLEGGRFCIIGLGKLGGRELNLGSDVDLLFVYEGEGKSVGGRTSIPAREYFSHFSRMLIRLIHERTASGMVWPVDMRLRPGGDGAPICANLDATLTYYREYGQTWERSMLIKARPIAGDVALGDAFVEGIAPFIYRRYLDYTTVTALAEMKRKIDARAGAGGIAPGFDVKRGKGAIREIEFAIQSIQLIHGGRRPELRIQSSLQALDRIRNGGFIRENEAASLAGAYRFWRRVEHAIQERYGEQTHRLPADFADYLSAATGMDAIEVELRARSTQVADIFSEYVLPAGRHATSGRGWLNGGREEEVSRIEPENRQRIQAALHGLNGFLARGLLPERSREQIGCFLDAAMPRWLDDANGVSAVESFAELVHAISGRATWIDLLATHRGVQYWLIGVLSASRYLSGHIVRDPSWLEWPLACERGESDIRHLCRQLDGMDDFTHIGDVLARLGRLVDQARVHCALAIDAHQADPLAAGAWLADCADAATGAALRLSLARMNLPLDFPFVALALGKHGSREMGLVSDLDMVFVLVHDGADEMPDGRSIREQAQRLGRRVIQTLTAQPPFGAGFDFDARLRPSGSGGILVTTLRSFRDYQTSRAQTWEHQALCRARAVAGPDSARAAVDRVVREVIARPRDKRKLAGEVMQMREKMLRYLADRAPGYINVKHDAGGLVDIEFLAQYARLAFGGDRTGTVDCLRHLPVHAPDRWRRQAGFLARCWLDYRQMENALRVELWRSIGRLPADPDADEWETMRRHAGIRSPEKLLATMQKTHACFRSLLGS